jgi:nucleotide-binding universal stress UspA family protein
MQTFGDGAPDDAIGANSTDTQTRPVFRRVLVAVADLTQVEHVADLARRAGASEACIVHLSLHDNIGGRRFPLESEASATRVVESAVLELSIAGIPATGHLLRALADKAAEAIVAEATQWKADLVVLGSPRRGELTTRLFGSVTLRVLLHAPCPVLVASAAGSDRVHHVKKGAAPVTA